MLPGTDMFDLKNHPKATILHPVDLKTLTESERKFGIAPKRGPEVEYQPDIILMEQGDKAIHSIATDGMTWTFDANAPHVSEFQIGKIVFATGRAVGRIIYLKREGDEVKAILGPIQLTDVIRNGHFAMDAPIDMNNLLTYVAPDFPQPADKSNPQNKSSLDLPENGWDRTVVVSRVSKSGRWTPTSMQKAFADGRRAVYEREGRRWVLQSLTPAAFSPGGPRRSLALPHLQRTGWEGQIPIPGVPNVYTPKPPDVSVPDLPPAPNVPTVDIQDLKVKTVADNSGVGLQYYYNKNGLNVSAYSLIQLRNAGLSFFLDIVDGKPLSCGLQLTGATEIKLNMGSFSTQEFNVNLHKTLWLPVDLSIPLGGGAVPFSLTFDQAFTISTGFSAKNSILTANGDYVFSGGVKAGFWNGRWMVQTPSSIIPKTDIGRSVAGVSVGINSLVMAASVRAMAGIGAFGFNSGVYATLRFDGTMLRAPDIAFPCRQGTIGAFIDSGLGYSMPEFVSDAINFFLSFVTDYRVQRAGTILKGPSTELFHGNTQVPGNCATPKQGGG